jgi:dTMP kinase
VTPGPGRGFLITFEGVDGCGKTTQAEQLCARLAARGLPVGLESAPGLVVREPGGTPVGERLRDVLLHSRLEIDPTAEALLYAAARAQLVAEVLRPALSAGRILVLDRYLDSSLAYQGHARGLGIDRVYETSLWATGGLLPDVTFVLEVDPEVAARRHGGEPDRIEREGLALQRRVAEGYRIVAARFPERVLTLDGERSAETIADDVDALTTGRLSVPSRGRAHV